MTPADRFYLPPPAEEYLQGDLFARVPSVFVARRPLKAARLWKAPGGRESWIAHPEEGQAPTGGFRWTMDETGEDVIVHGYLEMGMLLTHDCEIENDPKARTLAMVRPAEQLDEASRRRLFSGAADEGFYAIFPLEAQEAHPILERSFVDFRRLTTVHPDVLAASERVASLSEDLRHALAEQFRRFLFRPVNPSGGA